MPISPILRNPFEWFKNEAQKNLNDIRQLGVDLGTSRKLTVNLDATYTYDYEDYKERTPDIELRGADVNNLTTKEKREELINKFTLDGWYVLKTAVVVQVVVKYAFYIGLCIYEFDSDSNTYTSSKVVPVAIRHRKIPDEKVDEQETNMGVIKDIELYYVRTLDALFFGNTEREKLNSGILRQVARKWNLANFNIQTRLFFDRVDPKDVWKYYGQRMSVKTRVLLCLLGDNLVLCVIHSSNSNHSHRANCKCKEIDCRFYDMKTFKRVDTLYTYSEQDGNGNFGVQTEYNRGPNSGGFSESLRKFLTGMYFKLDDSDNDNSKHLLRTHAQQTKPNNSTGGKKRRRNRSIKKLKNRKTHRNYTSIKKKHK